MTERLVDSFGRRHSYLRISITDRCNFECDYCMPADGFQFMPKRQLLTDDEIVQLAEIFVSMGITKIRLTGGEPMSRTGLTQLIQRLSRLKHPESGLQSLTMTTNGYYLNGQANALRQAGLDSLNISLDSLKPERFSAITGKNMFKPVMLGVEDALQAGFDTVKLNVVLRAGVNDDELLDFVHFTKAHPVDIRFIEFMPFQGNGWQTDQLISYAAMRSRIEANYTLNPVATEASAVAKVFRVDGHQGSIGFITSMTESFCNSCDRLRITADGKLKTCLFQNAEADLRTLLHQPDADLLLKERVLQALQKKQEAHAPVNALAFIPNNPMIAIGG